MTNNNENLIFLFIWYYVWGENSTNVSQQIISTYKLWCDLSTGEVDFITLGKQMRKLPFSYLNIHHLSGVKCTILHLRDKDNETDKENKSIRKLKYSWEDSTINI